jgi:4-hydroxybenzoate polyprenyltransferase
MVDREDDLKIGIRTSAITLGQWDVAGVALFYVLALLCWGKAGAQAALGLPYVIGLTMAAAQACAHLWMIRHRDPAACFAAFRMNHWLGATVFAGVVLALH